MGGMADRNNHCVVFGEWRLFYTQMLKFCLVLFGALLSRGLSFGTATIYGGHRCARADGVHSGRAPLAILFLVQTSTRTRAFSQRGVRVSDASQVYIFKRFKLKVEFFFFLFNLIKMIFKCLRRRPFAAQSTNRCRNASTPKPTTRSNLRSDYHNWIFSPDNGSAEQHRKSASGQWNVPGRRRRRTLRLLNLSFQA